MSLRAGLIAGTAVGLLGVAAAQTPVVERLGDLSGAPLVFEAGEISRTAEGLILASGGVLVFAEGRGLRADALTYDPLTGVVTATGRVTIRDPDGSLTFAERIVVSDDLRDGVALEFAARLADDALLTAAYAERRGGVRNELGFATYSPCPVCLDGDDRTPFWRIRARKATQKKDSGNIVYRDVFFDLLGVPILYSPVLAHPDPGVERQSGFLAPKPGRSSELGAFIEVPYHFALAPSYDFTFTPTPTTEAGVLLKGDWRQRLYSGGYQFSGSFVHFDGTTRNGLPTPQANRWHVFGDGRFRLSDTWTWGFDAERTSDDTFIRFYNIDPVRTRRGRAVIDLGNRLESDIYLEGRAEDFYLLAEGVFFQGLRAQDNDLETPKVLPSLRARKALTPPLIGGRLDMIGDVVALRRPVGAFDGDEDLTRASFQGRWARAFTIGPGLRFQPFAEARTDVFAIETDGADVRLDIRGAPTGGAELSWPFARRGRAGRQIIEPVVFFAATDEVDDDAGLLNPVQQGGFIRAGESFADLNPGVDEDDLIQTPGQVFVEASALSDSVVNEFDDTNLLRSSRASGFDVFEDGVRTAVALRSDLRWNNGVNIDILAGRLFRFSGDSPYSPNSGLGDDRSDIVGRFSIGWRNRIFARSRARFDPDGFNIRRADLSLGGRVERLDVNFRYTLASDDAVDGVEAREELFFRGATRIYGGFSIFGQLRRDLRENTNIEAGGGFIYENDCALFSFTVRRDSTQDRDDRPDTTVLFTLSLKSLGEFGTP